MDGDDDACERLNAAAVLVPGTVRLAVTSIEATGSQGRGEGIFGDRYYTITSTAEDEHKWRVPTWLTVSAREPFSLSPLLFSFTSTWASFRSLARLNSSRPPLAACEHHLPPSPVPVWQSSGQGRKTMPAPASVPLPSAASSSLAQRREPLTDFTSLLGEEWRSERRWPATSTTSTNSSTTLIDGREWSTGEQWVSSRRSGASRCLVRSVLLLLEGTCQL